jgi:hypothetical protein
VVDARSFSDQRAADYASLGLGHVLGKGDHTTLTQTDPRIYAQSPLGSALYQNPKNIDASMRAPGDTVGRELGGLPAPRYLNFVPVKKFIVLY